MLLSYPPLPSLVQLSHFVELEGIDIVQIYSTPVQNWTISILQIIKKERVWFFLNKRFQLQARSVGVDTWISSWSIETGWTWSTTAQWQSAYSHIPVVRHAEFISISTFINLEFECSIEKYDKFTLYLKIMVSLFYIILN